MSNSVRDCVALCCRELRWRRLRMHHCQRRGRPPAAACWCCLRRAHRHLIVLHSFVGTLSANAHPRSAAVSLFILHNLTYTKGCICKVRSPCVG